MPGADFEDHVLLVVGILGNEQDLDFGEQPIALGGQRAQLLLRELAHVGILEQFFGRGDLADDIFVLAERFNERLNLGQRLRMAAKRRRIALYGRVRHLGHQLVVLRLGRG